MDRCSASLKDTDLRGIVVFIITLVVGVAMLYVFPPMLALFGTLLIVMVVVAIYYTARVMTEKYCRR